MLSIILCSSILSVPISVQAQISSDDCMKVARLAATSFKARLKGYPKSAVINVIREANQPGTQHRRLGEVIVNKAYNLKITTSHTQNQQIGTLFSYEVYNTCMGSLQ